MVMVVVDVDADVVDNEVTDGGVVVDSSALMDGGVGMVAAQQHADYHRVDKTKTYCTLTI
jgi:hypothetical protein